MECFPDQSQINIFLNRMTEENVAQLRQDQTEPGGTWGLWFSSPAT